MLALSRLIASALALAALAGGGTAFAGLGQPSPWQMGLQEAAAPVMADVVAFHTILLYVIGAVVAFVLVLLLIVIVRFNRNANPIPRRTTHNTLIEMLWTIVP